MQEVTYKQEQQDILVSHDKLQEDLRGEVILDLSNHRTSCLHRVCTEKDPSKADEMEGNDLPCEALPTKGLTATPSEVIKDLHIQLVQSKSHTMDGSPKDKAESCSMP